MCWRYLFSRSVARQVSSARVSLTSVFGMGTGGPSPRSTPTYFLLKKKVSKENFHRTLLSLPPFSAASITLFTFPPHRFANQRSVCETERSLFLSGDPYGNRTHVCGVRGRRLNRLTNGPHRLNMLLLEAGSLPGVSPPSREWYTFRDSNPGHPD